MQTSKLDDVLTLALFPEVYPVVTEMAYVRARLSTAYVYRWLRCIYHFTSKNYHVLVLLELAGRYMSQHDRVTQALGMS